MIRLTALFLSLSLAACASSPHHAQVMPQNLSALSADIPLACEYEKRVTTSGHAALHPSDWHFWRDHSRTETRDDQTRLGETWERDSQGGLSYTRIYYDEKAMLEYNSVDLLTSGQQPDWQQLWSLIDPKTLNRELKRIETDVISGISLEHYSGEMDGMHVELDWLPSLKLPAYLEKKHFDGSFSLKLKACHTVSPAVGEALSKTDFRSFRQLEYTDLGDMESDPQVQRILKSTGEHVHH